MAEAISIPSPSAFLRSSTPPSPAKAESQIPKNARKQGEQAKKKKAARKRSVGASAGEPIGPKPKQSKSRNGCVTCKAKRLKCGEEKPGCQQCARRGVECGGYKKDFKWRPFEETNIIRSHPERPKRVLPTRRTTDDCVDTAHLLTDGAGVPPPTRNDTGSQHEHDESSSPVEARPIATDLPARQSKATQNLMPTAEDKRKDSRTGSLPREVATQVGNASSIPVAGEGTICPNELQQSPVLSNGSSPTLTQILENLPASQSLPPAADFISFSMPEDMQYPITPMAVPELEHGGNEAVEEDLADMTADDLMSISGPLFLSTGQDAPLIVSDPSASSDEVDFSQWDGPISYLYSQPYFAQDSAEMLTFRFDRLTCGILSVMDGPNENPWRSLIWPLAQQSPALYHAIMAMTSFHSSTDVPALRIVGHEHKQASIRYIQQGIRDNTMNDQTAIATALALGFSESWDQHTKTGNTHIKGAQALVKRALANYQSDPLGDVELARLKFLCNAWVYMDVIARLTSVDSDESHDFDNTLLFASDSPQMVMGDMEQHPGFGIDFGMPIDARLDPLMGCANTLFPLIGRVANLVRKVCRSQTNSPAVITQAHDLKLALETWDPPAFIERPEDPTTDVQHTLQTAEAYRWATLLHLHQSVPELPSTSSTELAQRVLQYLATVPLVSRTVIVQIYPLMVAGCCALTEEDRQWVRERWIAMGQRMRIGVIDKSAMVTEEVWRRQDAYEAQPTTRRKLVATSELSPARTRGTPLARSSTGAFTADPGRTGMVFSYVDVGDDGAKPASGDGRWPPRSKAPERSVSNVDPAYTVRGHLHWIGVMWDWSWEVLLG